MVYRRPAVSTANTSRFSAKESDSERDTDTEEENNTSDEEDAREPTPEPTQDSASNPDVTMSGTQTIPAQTFTQPAMSQQGGGGGPPPPNPAAGGPGGPGEPGGPGGPGGPIGFGGLPGVPMAHPGGEIGINRPQPFDGNAEDLEQFVTSCRVYFTMNEHIYNTNTKKILFILSYCTKGKAAVFTSHFLDTQLAQVPNMTMDQFYLNHFYPAFIGTDSKGEAKRKLDHLRQTKRADEYINQFIMLAHQANITEYEALVQRFQQGLQPQILQAIYWRENLPRDMEGWYQAARQIDQGLEQMKNAQAGYYTTS